MGFRNTALTGYYILTFHMKIPNYEDDISVCLSEKLPALLYMQERAVHQHIDRIPMPWECKGATATSTAAEKNLQSKGELERKNIKSVAFVLKSKAQIFPVPLHYEDVKVHVLEIHWSEPVPFLNQPEQMRVCHSTNVRFLHGFVYYSAQIWGIENSCLSWG